MSRITLSGNASGTGNFTLASPNSNTDRTLTLPDATGTFVYADASGNVGIGTSSPSYRLHVNSATAVDVETGVTNSAGTSRFGTRGSGNAFAGAFTAGKSLELWSAGNLNATLDSSGNLLVGATSGSARGLFNQAGSGPSIQTGQTNASFTGNAVNIRVDRNTSNSTYNFIGCAREGVADVFFVRDSGNVVNANNSYGAISDVKLKENVTDATPKLEKLNQVRIVNFNMKGDEQKQLGVIAQELEQIFPSIVEETIDRDDEGNDLGTTTKSVKYSVFVPMLIKAMQEQQATITALEARITALEAN